MVRMGPNSAIMCSEDCPRCKAMLQEESSQSVHTRAEIRAKRQPPPETKVEKATRVIERKRKRHMREAAKEARSGKKLGKIKSLKSYFPSK